MPNLLSQYWKWWIVDGIIQAPGFLANDLPPSASPAAKFGQELGRRACQRVPRTAGTGGLYGLGVWGYLCMPYLDSIDEGPTEPGENLDPPFTGGQCPGVVYEGWANFRVQTGVVNGVRQYAYSPTKQQATLPTLGPITVGPSETIIGAEPPPNNACYPARPVTYTESVAASGLGVQYNWRVRQDNVTFEDAPACQSSPWSAINLEFRRQDGQPDTCGDPPGEETSPTFPPNLPPLPPPSTDPPWFDIDWDVTLSPDLDIIFCIGGQCDPPEDPFPTAPTPPPPPPVDLPGGPGVPTGPPQDTDPDSPTPNEISGCLEPGLVLTGLKVLILDYDSSVGATQGVFRRVAWVWMGPGEGLLDLVEDGANIESGQFIIPDSWDCTCWKVRSNPGFRLRIQPYARTLVTE